MVPKYDNTYAHIVRVRASERARRRPLNIVIFKQALSKELAVYSGLKYVYSQALNKILCINKCCACFMAEYSNGVQWTGTTFGWTSHKTSYNYFYNIIPNSPIMFVQKIPIKISLMTLKRNILRREIYFYNNTKHLCTVSKKPVI